MFKSKIDYKIFYIKNFSVWVYKKQLRICASKIPISKKKITKDDYIYLLYTTYLQLVENFYIFLLVLHQSDGIDNLYISQFNLYKKIYDVFWVDIDLDGKIKNKHNQKLSLKKYMQYATKGNVDEYAKYIFEATEDRLKHKNLLNSFKHWFRLSSNWESSLSIADNWPVSVLWKLDSTLVYFYKEKSDDKIYKVVHGFNYEYILLKSEFIVSAIENIRKDYLFAQNKTTKPNYRIIAPGESAKLKNGSFTLPPESILF